MKNSPGYNATEVGVIPSEWECLPICSVATLESGHTPGRTEPTYWNGSIPWVSLHDTEQLDGKEITKTTYTVTQKGIDNSSARVLPKGTVIFSRTATVGKATILGGNMATSQDFANYICGPRLHNHFLVYLFRSMVRTWQSLMAGSTHQTIYMPTFRKLLIPLPPLREQLAIAAALSDVDALLEGLDRLIAKKRDLKQAAMQQLLTGETRLPGFGGEWETKRLGELFSLRIGSSKSRYIVQGGRYLVVDMGAVARDGRLIASKRTEYRDDFLIRGDLVMPKDDIGGGNIIGKIAFIDENDRYILGDHVYALRLVEGESQFFAYMINAYEVNRSLRSKAAGSAQLGLSRKAVLEQEVLVPGIAEQKAIARALSDMDADIDVLDQRRAKTADLKQAMMQELLTGRTRLVSPEVAHA